MMKFTAPEGGRKFRQRVEAAAPEAKKLGLKTEFRANRMEVVLSWRYRTPQNVFCASLEEGILTGDVQRVGKAWQWYDYLLFVFCCILVVPLVAVAIAGSGPAVLSSYATGNFCTASETWFGLPLGSGKRMEKRLEKYLTETLSCTPTE